MNAIVRPCWWPLVGVALLAGPAAHASTSLSFLASIVQIELDSGNNLFGGVDLSTRFHGSFSYADSASLNVLEPNEASYRPAGASTAMLQWGSSGVSGSDVAVVVQNDWPLDDESVAFAGQLGLNVAVGTPIDSWAVDGLSQGAYEADPDPNDGDDTQVVYDGVRFEFALVSLDTSLYQNLDYRPMPPIGSSDLGAFIVEQGDDQGNTVFLAYGHILSVGVVPEPASGWLLGLGLAGLLPLVARRRGA